MENILYLDDYINFYNKKIDKLLVIKPYKNTLRNGLIIDRNKFNKIFKKALEQNNITSGLLNENLVVIITSFYTNEDKALIKDIMENINYKNIKFIQELEYLKLNKNNVYINCNYEYFYFIYTNDLGKITTNIYKNDFLNKELFLQLIYILNKREIYLYGKNYKEFINIIKTQNINYYYFEYGENLLINKLLKNV